MPINNLLESDIRVFATGRGKLDLHEKDASNLRQSQNWMPKHNGAAIRLASDVPNVGAEIGENPVARRQTVNLIGFENTVPLHERDPSLDLLASVVSSLRSMALT
ncbi:hypothetical protein D3C87_1881410 [compost metagenome]